MNEKRTGNRPRLDPPAKPLPCVPVERQPQESEQDKKRWQSNTNAGEDTQQQDRGPDQD